MPPSGFNQKAINGLLEFVKACYEHVLSDYQSTNEVTYLKEKSSELEKITTESLKLIYPKISSEGVIGLSTFMKENYLELIKEIYVGKKNNGEAISKEIDNIRNYLTGFEI
jgi:hypothetical protein